MLARGVALVCAFAAAGLATVAGAEDDGLATIQAGAWELGFNGSFLSREGSVFFTHDPGVGFAQVAQDAKGRFSGVAWS